MREEHQIVDRRDHHIDLHQQHTPTHYKMFIAHNDHIFEHTFDEHEMSEPLADQNIDLLFELEIFDGSTKDLDAITETVSFDQIDHRLDDVRLIDHVDTFGTGPDHEHR